jgi:hypothetical protein
VLLVEQLVEGAAAPREQALAIGQTRQRREHDQKRTPFFS